MTGGRRRRFLAHLDAGSDGDTTTVTAVALCGVCRALVGAVERLIDFVTEPD